eukprot:8795136-Alexandrium_andersonii.AAC.1
MDRRAISSSFGLRNCPSTARECPELPETAGDRPALLQAASGRAKTSLKRFRTSADRYWRSLDSKTS